MTPAFSSKNGHTMDPNLWSNTFRPNPDKTSGGHLGPFLVLQKSWRGAPLGKGSKKEKVWNFPNF